MASARAGAAEIVRTEPVDVLGVPGTLMVAAYGGGAALCTGRLLFDAVLPPRRAPRGLAPAVEAEAAACAGALAAAGEDARVVPAGDLASIAALSAAPPAVDWQWHVVVSSLPYGAEEVRSPAMPGGGAWVQCNAFWHGWALSAAAGRRVGGAGFERGAGSWPLAGPAAVPAGSESAAAAAGSLGAWAPAEAAADPAWLVPPPGAATATTAGAAGGAPCRLQPCDTHCHTVGGSDAEDGGGEAAGLRAAMADSGMSDADIDAALDAMGVAGGKAEWHIGGDTGRFAAPASVPSAGWFVALDLSGQAKAGRARALGVLLVTVPGGHEASVEACLRKAEPKGLDCVLSSLAEAAAAAGCAPRDAALLRRVIPAP